MIYGIFFIFAGYLSGSILFAYLIPKYFYHIDICRLSDDQNPGAFNAFTHTGIKTGTLILLLELAKGFFPVHIALHVLSPTDPLFALVLAAPVIGHAFPLFIREWVEKRLPSPLGACWDFILICVLY